MAEEIKSVVMFDLDGCLSDDAWRLHLIPPDAKDQNDWDAYHSVCDQDKPLQQGAIVLKSHIDAGQIILFTTARPINMGEKTAQWIEREFNITPQKGFSILMRQEGDTRGAVELKREFAGFIIKNSQQNGSPIVAAYDDREDIVDMYRSMGLNACVLNKDGVQIYEPKQAPAVIKDQPVFEEIREPASAATILSEMAMTYIERNAIYGDNAHKVGEVMKVLFPNGVTIRTEADHHLYHLFELIIVKLTRFTNSGLTHQDSIHDLTIYGAMVENLVNQKKHSIEVHKMKSIVITGSSSGLGAVLMEVLEESGHQVFGYDHSVGDDVTEPALWLADLSHVDVLINCAGVNDNRWFEEVKADDFFNIMDVNAFSMVRMTQALLPQLKESKGTVINIVSNAAHIPMTSSLSYNASKAAALMITRQMAHELTPKYGITFFSVSPNKLEGTAMSKAIEANVCRVRGWTAEYASEYQKRALMHGLETPPVAVAEFIDHLISSGSSLYLSGCDIPFGK